MQSITLPKGAFYLMAGLFILLALFVLMGANTQQSVGRYRMTIVTRNNFTDIFVIDTTSGVIKYVGKDEGKPFDRIKGK